jgi:hypothetical protein
MLRVVTYARVSTVANKCHHANDCTYPSTDYAPVFDDATKRHPAFQLGLRIPLGIIPLAASERR